MHTRVIISAAVIMLLLALPFSLTAQRRDAKSQKPGTHKEHLFADLRNTFSKIDEHIPVAEFKSSIQIAKSKFRKLKQSNNHRRRVRSKSEVFVLMQFSIKTRERH